MIPWVRGKRLRTAGRKRYNSRMMTTRRVFWAKELLSWAALVLGFGGAVGMLWFAVWVAFVMGGTHG